jgi:hypothetical protein
MMPEGDERHPAFIPYTRQLFLDFRPATLPFPYQPKVAGFCGIFVVLTLLCCPLTDTGK